MIRICCAVPASPRITAGIGRCLAQVPRPGHAPRRVLELGREQPADVGVEQDEAQVEEHQGEQEVRDREPDEADERRHVVAHRVLPDRGVDADGQGEHPREDQRGHRDDHGQPQALADHLGDGPPPLHRHAEVALHDQPHPLEVLHVDRLPQAVLDPEVLRLLVGDHAAHRRHLGDVGGDVVARRKLDDGEGEDGDRPDGEDREERATADVRQHGSEPGSPPPHPTPLPGGERAG